MTETLSTELGHLKRAKAEQDGVLEQTLTEREEAEEENKLLIAANMAADETTVHLNREVSDVRQLNVLLCVPGSSK